MHYLRVWLISFGVAMSKLEVNEVSFLLYQSLLLNEGNSIHPSALGRFCCCREPCQFILQTHEWKPREKEHFPLENLSFRTMSSHICRENLISDKGKTFHKFEIQMCTQQNQFGGISTFVQCQEDGYTLHMSGASLVESCSIVCRDNTASCLMRKRTLNVQCCLSAAQNAGSRASQCR